MTAQIACDLRGHFHPSATKSLSNSLLAFTLKPMYYLPGFNICSVVYFLIGIFSSHLSGWSIASDTC